LPLYKEEDISELKVRGKNVYEKEKKSLYNIFD
jgi:hypothetical protein